MNIVEVLSEHHNCVMYDRAGIGYSKASPSLEPWDDYKENLRDLIEATSRLDQEIVLCGHSLGGHLLASRELDTAGRRAVGSVLLDPANPEAYRQQHLVAEGNPDGFDQSLRSLGRNTALGIGWMLDPNIWHLGGAGADRNRYLGRLYRQPYIWSAARDEWLAYTRETKAGINHNPLDPNPVMIIVAGQTAQRNPEYVELYRDIASRHPYAVEIVKVVNASHDGLLSVTSHARAVSEHLHRFVSDVNGGEGN